MLEWLGQVPVIGGLATYVLPFLLLLSLVVFVHEWGHYIVARACGIRSEVFSIGFGPEIFGWTDRRRTRWRFGIIPLGGYVRFSGDLDVASVAGTDAVPAPGSFAAARLRDRALVVAAGPAMNMVFAALAFAAVAGFGGLPAGAPVVGTILDGERMTGLGLMTGDRIESVAGRPVATGGEALQFLQDTAGAPVVIELVRAGQWMQLQGRIDAPVEIGLVGSGTAADEAGMKRGDRVRRVDGEPLHSFGALRARVLASNGAELALEVERDNRLLTLYARPTPREQVDPATGERVTVPVLGVSRKPLDLFRPARESLGLLDSLAWGVEQTVWVVVLSLQFVGDLLVGEGDAGNLGGPIAIAEFSGDAAQRGGWDFLHMLALISASIGLINLFPIPVLDGGHLVLFALEAVRGRPLGARASRYLGWLGLTLIVTLMVFVTYNDIVRF